MTVNNMMRHSLYLCVLMVFVCFQNLAAHDHPHPHNRNNPSMAGQHDDLYFTQKFHLPGYTGEELGKIEYPSIAIDSKGILYIAYNFTMENGKEAVFLNSFNTAGVEFEKPEHGDYLEMVKAPDWNTPLQVSTGSGVEYRPRIAVTPDDVVWIVWSARRDKEWKVYGRTYYEGELGNEIQLTSNQGYNFRPVVLADGSDRIWIAWERGTDEKDMEIVAKYFSNGTWSDEISIESRPGYAYRPYMLEAPDGTIWFSWDYTHGYTTNVYINSFKDGRMQQPVQVSHHPAIDSKSAMSWYDDKLWIAWTTNRRGDDGWGIIRYTKLRAFDGERWYVTQGDMPEVDLKNRSETQSYEYPTVTFDNSGRLYLFNRHDHVFSGTYYDGEQWADYGNLDEAGWGLRGFYVHFAWESDNELWVARRDRTSIFLQKMTRNDPQEKNIQLIEYDPVEYPAELQGIAGDSDRGPTRHGEYKVYYGDIHTHTAYSDGSGSFDELFNLYKNVYRVDFLAITEHDAMGGGSNHYSPGAWAYMKALNEIYYVPGEFVTINAYEWTH